MCGFMVNGVAHGPQRGTTLCQLHMRHFKDGDELYLEPWRARAFPVIKDLVVDRSAFDRIIAAGGFISVPTGSAPDGNAILVPKENAERCHGRRGLHRLRRLRGHVPERLGVAVHRRQDRAPGPAAAGPARARPARAGAWWRRRTPEGFGSCTNIGECEAVCPKEIKLEVIARMNRDFIKASWTSRGASAGSGSGG